MSIDTVRDALIKLRSFAKGLDCDYQEECTPGEDDMCQSCKHVYIADNALAALATIDPDTIRRECADKAIHYIDNNVEAYRYRIEEFRAAIISPSQRQS